MTAFQVSVAPGAGLITDGRKVDPVTMFEVTSGAIGSRGLRRVMSRAIVAGEASTVGGFCGKCAGLDYVAGGALFFQYGMGSRQTAAGVDAGVARQTFFSDPKKSQQQEEKAQPKLGAFQRRRPLEIIEVDALRELLCCACASQNLSSNCLRLAVRRQKRKIQTLSQ